MAKKPDEEKDISFPNQKIVNINLEHEMENAYIEYAMSVIVGRALPDVRDGLKPVHRRILYSMYESGLTSDKPFKKSATCVGDVLGKYHPHGDASVYDAMVRLGQDFSMRYCLVEGHGNFGSIDGDPPAAYRYTEARMSKIANEMLRDIEKETVDWDPNFDESRKEPRVLPSRFPNLLVNGSSGIAVGMTTNIPPHNLREVIDATICVLDNREATLDDLMEHIKGPDFPTRGIIMGRSGIRAAYATGKGHIRVRARTEMEEFGNGRTRIIVTELPYQVNKSRLVENIADQVKEKRLEGISGLRDESDGKKGMRIVIELKKDANPQVVLNRLFAQTQMQTTFAVVMLALVNNQRQPKILTLRGILDEYIAFQEQIITRRTIYDRRKAQERAHLLQGLLIAQDNIDEVIHIIRTSYDDAKDKLMERFGLDDVQAQAILDMQLKRLQGLEKEKLEAEFAELEKKIAYYDQLLSDEEMLRGVLKDELIQIRDKYGDDRKTEIGFVEDDIDIEDLIEEEQCVFTMTQAGYLKRTPASEYAAQSKGGMGKKGITTREEDVVESVFTASTHDEILFFTDKGKVYKKKGYQIPQAGKTAKGTNIVNVLQVESGERVQVMLHVEKMEQESYLVMVTRKGHHPLRPEKHPEQRHPGHQDGRGRPAGGGPPDRREEEDPHCHPRRNGRVLRRERRAGHGPGRLRRAGHQAERRGLRGGRRPGHRRQDGAVHYGKRLRQAHPGGGVPHHQPGRPGHQELRRHREDRKRGGHQGGGRLRGPAAGHRRRYPHPHPRGRHPHRRACHPGRHRHALQGGGGPGDLPGSGRAGGGRIHNSRGKCGKPGHSRAGN